MANSLVRNPVTVNGAGVTSPGVTNSTVSQFSHTVTPGNLNTAIIVLVGIGSTTVGVTVGVLWGAQSLVAGSKYAIGGSTTDFVQIFYLFNPLPGTKTVTVSTSAASTINAGAHSYSGVNGLDAPGGTAGSATASTTYNTFYNQYAYAEILEVVGSGPAAFSNWAATGTSTTPSVNLWYHLTDTTTGGGNTLGSLFRYSGTGAAVTSAGFNYSAPTAILWANSFISIYGIDSGSFSALTASDSATVADATAAEFVTDSAADTAVLSDDSTLFVSDTASDSATLTEGTSSTFTTRTAADSAILTDTRTGLFVTDSAADSATLTDSTLTSTRTSSASDSAILTDAVVDIFKGQAITGSDSAILSDASILSVTQTRSDSGVLTDKSSVNKFVSDSMTLTETAIVGVIASDSMVLTDRTTVFNRTVQEFATLTDTFQAINAVLPVVNDTFTLFDEVTEGGSLNATKQPTFEDIVLYRDQYEDTGFRVIAQQIFGNKEFIHWNLPLSDIELGFTLTGANTFKGNLNSEIPSLLNLDPPMIPGGTWIHVEDGGEIRASYILDPFVDENGAQKRTVTATGFSSILNGLYYEGDLYRVIQEDPAVIARFIWRHTQSYAGSNLGIAVNPFTVTPKKLGTQPKQVDFETGDGQSVSFEAGPYDLNYWEVTNLGTEFKKLMSETPMEYIEKSYWNDPKTNILHYLDMKYPRVGTKREDLQFREGENLAEILPSISQTKESQCNEVIVIGAGEGQTAIRAWVSWADGRIRKTHLIESEDITSLKRAQDIALFEANRIRRMGNVIDKAVVKTEHINALWGTFAQGDDIYLDGQVIYHGRVQGLFRIVSYIYQRRTRRAILDLAPSESFTYGGIEP